MHTLRECAEIGSGEHTMFDVDPPHVLAHRATGESGSMLFLHNLADEPCRVAVGVPADQPGRPLSVLADGDYPENVDLGAIELNGYGYRWIRLSRNP